jgi:hypothetical protein
MNYGWRIDDGVRLANHTISEDKTFERRTTASKQLY